MCSGRAEGDGAPQRGLPEVQESLYLVPPSKRSAAEAVLCHATQEQKNHLGTI